MLLFSDSPLLFRKEDQRLTGTSLLFRRQTAEEREQERQAATKYFLSMQLGSMAAPPPSIITPLSATTPSGSHALSKEFRQTDKDAISALESIRPWSASLPNLSNLPAMQGAMDVAVSVANAAAHAAQAQVQAHAQAHAQAGVVAAFAAASSKAEGELPP